MFERVEIYEIYIIHTHTHTYIVYICVYNVYLTAHVNQLRCAVNSATYKRI